MKLIERSISGLLILIGVSITVGWASYNIGYKKGKKRTTETTAFELADKFPEAGLCKEFKIYYKDDNHNQIYPQEPDYLEKHKEGVIGIGIDIYDSKDCIYWIILKSKT